MSIKKTRQIFSEDFKKQVAAKVIGGQMSKEAARRTFGIKGKSAVTDWIRFYGESEEEAILPDMTPEEKEQMFLLKKEIEELKCQLVQSRHKEGLLNAMIDIAEERFKISIRKKSGAKRCSNTKPENQQ